MKCQQCRRREALKIHRQLCRPCLIRLAESAVKHSIGIKALIKKQKRLVFADDGTAASKFLGRVLKKVLGGYPMRVNVVMVKNVNDISGLTKSYDKIIIAASIEDEINSFLAALVSKKGKTGKATIISPLKKFTAPEIGYLSGKVEGKMKKKRTSGSLGAFLEAAERRYPGSKFALLKSSEKFT